MNMVERNVKSLTALITIKEELDVQTSFTPS